jgi:ketosteroid isomerase-like protein
MIYRSIVRRRVNHLFNEANNGNWEAIVESLAPQFSYRFVGDTPLGGTRTTHDAMRQWFERLYRLFPGSQFAPETIVVEGPPWHTTVMTYVKIRGTAPGDDGLPHPYENEFMQRSTLRWGRLTDVLTLEDTQRFANALPALAASGVIEATLQPITDATPADGPRHEDAAVRTRIRDGANGQEPDQHRSS